MIGQSLEQRTQPTPAPALTNLQRALAIVALMKMTMDTWGSSDHKTRSVLPLAFVDEIDAWVRKEVQEQVPDGFEQEAFALAIRALYENREVPDGP